MRKMTREPQKTTYEERYTDWTIEKWKLYTENEYHINFKKKFGEKVKEIRKKRELSQEELAYKSNLHRTYISEIERWLKNISLINIGKLAEWLNVFLKDLMDF